MPDYRYLAEQWFEQAMIDFREGEPEKAAAAAQIASAAVFLTDSEQVVAQAVDAAQEDMIQAVEGGTIALYRMAEAVRVLQEAVRRGPRHPAIHQALDILTGVEADRTDPSGSTPVE